MNLKVIANSEIPKALNSSVTRYKNGLNEKERSFFKPMKERFTAANGEGSWDSYLQLQRTAVDHAWSEMLYVHPELGSK